MAQIVYALAGLDLKPREWGHCRTIAGSVPSTRYRSFRSLTSSDTVARARVATESEEIADGVQPLPTFQRREEGSQDVIEESHEARDE